MNRRARALLVIITGSLSGVSLSAQEPTAPLPTVVEGITVDAQSGLPFPNVQVRFDTGERITSDEHGNYTITGVAPGHHRVALVTGRCNVTFAYLELAPGAIKRVAFQVPSEMVGTKPSQEELKKKSEGEYVTADELQAMRARNLLEALRRVAPDMVGPEGGLPGSSASLMGRTRTAQGVTAPLVVIDGILVSDGVRALRDFKPGDVYSLEVLRGASRGWSYGTGGAGGVIKVETRQGDLGFGVQPPDRCEIGDWTGTEGGQATGPIPSVSP
jgi:TonB-dependent starch-binding outer membrane protein SusC